MDVLTGSPLSPPLDTHLTSIKCDPRPCSCVGCGCGLIYQSTLSLQGTHFLKGKQVSAHAETHPWLFSACPGANAFTALPLNILTTLSIQFQKNFASVFCVSNELPPNTWRTDSCDILFYTDWVWGISFHLQNTYKMQGISSALFPAPYGREMGLLLIVYTARLSYNVSCEM